ncbi:MAG: TRAP transporter large permease [Myxococcota bacterium]
MTAAIAMVATFVVLLLVRVPVSFAIGLAAFLGFALTPDPFDARESFALLTGMTGTLKQNPLVAIPFFILAGQIMGSGGIASRLVDLSRSLLAGVRGGTSQVNVLSSLFFGGISGSAVADVSSIGSILLPVMKEEGYEPEYSTAITVTSATLGLILPPSNVMILFAVIAGGVALPTGHSELAVGVDTMFLAGVVPGLAVAITLMVLCAVQARRRNHPRGAWPGLRVLARRAVAALPALAIVWVILGGILFGWTLTYEAAALAVVGAAAAGLWVYRELRLGDVPRLLAEAVVTTGVVFFLIATSSAMTAVLLQADIDRILLEVLTGLTQDPLLFLLLLNVVALTLGLFLDLTPALLILTPLFLPVAVSYGIHPVHFGVVLLVNLCIGLCTPPVGSCLFVGSAIADVPIERVARALLPFYAAMLVALALITLFPPLSLWLPEWFESTR